MFQAVRRYLTGPEPVVCYQGALVADPSSGEFLLHVPIPVDLAREAIAAVQDSGHGLNCYVDDELYVAAVTPEAESYASFQHIELHVVGPLLDWLERPPTKLVVVGDPERLDALGASCAHSSAGGCSSRSRCRSSSSSRTRTCRRARGCSSSPTASASRREQTIAFGDGENDLELIDWAGYSVAVGNAHPLVKARADLTCPPAEEEGVAQVLEAFLAR